MTLGGHRIGDHFDPRRQTLGIGVKRGGERCPWRFFSEIPAGQGRREHQPTRMRANQRAIEGKRLDDVEHQVEHAQGVDAHVEAHAHMEPR